MEQTTSSSFCRSPFIAYTACCQNLSLDALFFTLYYLSIWSHEAKKCDIKIGHPLPTSGKDDLITTSHQEFLPLIRTESTAFETDQESNLPNGDAKILLLDDEIYNLNTEPRMNTIIPHQFFLRDILMGDNLWSVGRASIFFILKNKSLRIMP
ncbi:MAG: hypothetical protein GY846_24135 [Deltaproteobacteria bacterium]|nr:hypothetical protein [Deltaproteobacteria bacterium]